MGSDMKKGKKNYKKPVIVGFSVLYLFIVGLATWMVKEKTVEEWKAVFEETASSLLREASAKEFAMEQEGWSREEREKFYRILSNEWYQSADKESLQISVAFYDEEMNLLSQSQDGLSSMGWINTDTHEGEIYGLKDVLSAGEREDLAAYQWENISSGYEKPEPYRISVRVSPDGQTLQEILVQRLIWKEGVEDASYTDPITGSGHTVTTGSRIDYVTGRSGGEERIFCETGSEVVWKWENPEKPAGRWEKEGQFETVILTFPYMNYLGSLEAWSRWENSAFLQDYPEQAAPYQEAGTEYPLLRVDSNLFYYRAGYQLQVGMAGQPSAYMEIRMEENPWRAALSDMKYIWITGFVLCLACMMKVIFAFGRITDRQAAMEEARRDFINAMAHELKTPLGVVRNFAENLLEHNMEEKRDYYLSRIIEQTGEMDRLVKDMIEASKLDSEELHLKKESVSFRELLREQMARFETALREKNLRVEYEEEADFRVNGDREYLAEAVWNLLSNAVEYNLPEGSILIRTEADRCIIENTGAPLGEEQLAHAFDLLYTGEEGRSRRGGHTGMGLYLARKILSLHDMNLTLENAGRGIRAVVEKQRRGRTGRGLFPARRPA